MGAFFYWAITIDVLAIVAAGLGGRVLKLGLRQKIAFGAVAGLGVVLLIGLGWQNVKQQRQVEAEAARDHEASLQGLKRLREATAETEREGQDYRRELAKLTGGQEPAAAASGSSAGNAANAAGKPAGAPRVLASDQRESLVKQLKKMGPHAIVVRYAQSSEEAQRYADALASALRDAGWTFRTPKFIQWDQDPHGLLIIVDDLHDVPREADQFAVILNNVGIEVKWLEESSLDPGTFDLMIGLQ